MAETREVVLKMTVDPRQAAQEMGKLAEETTRAGKAATDAEARYQQMVKETHRTLGGLRAGLAEQQKSYGSYYAARQETARAQAPGAGSPGFLSSPIATGGMLGPGSLIGGYVGLSAVSGAAQGAEQLAEASGRAGEAFRLMTQSIVNAIPVLGTLNKSIGSIAEAVSGVASVRAGAGRFLAGATAQNIFAATQGQLQFGAANELNQLRVQQAGLADRTAAATSFRQALEQPGVLESLRPRARFGEATEATGGLRSGVLQSEAALAATTRRQEAAQRGLDQAEADLARLRGQEPGLRQAAVAAGQRATKAGLLAENFTGPAGGFQAAQQQFGAEAAAANQRLAENQRRIAEQELQIKERTRQVEEATTEQAQKRFDLAQRQLALDRDRLAIVNQQVEAGRAGATTAGAARPGTLEATAAAIRQAQQYGIETTTDQQRALISGFGPAGQDFLQRRFEERGRGLPGFQEVQQLLGQQPLEDLETQKAALQDQIERGGAAAAERLAQETEQAFNRALDRIADAIADTIEVKLGELSAKLEEQQNRRLLEGNR